MNQYFRLPICNQAQPIPCGDWADRFDPPLGCPRAHLLNPRIVNVITEENPMGTLVPMYIQRHAWTPPPKKGIVGIIRDDVLDAVLECCKGEFEKAFYIGEVTPLKKSRSKHKYHSIVAKSTEFQLSVRGGKSSLFSYCDDCGQLGYAASGGDDFVEYLLEFDVRTDKMIYAERIYSLYLREDAAERFMARGFPKVKLDKMKMRKTPLDGLPIDLNELPKDFRMNMRRVFPKTSEPNAHDKIPPA